MDKIEEEKKFLKKLAISTFNTQYGRNIDLTECSISSIRPNYGGTLGYEIQTLLLADNVRLRVYFTMGYISKLENYRLEVDEKFIQTRLGDEVYVAVGTLDRGLVDFDTYKFRWIDKDYAALNLVQFMDGTPIKTMMGEEISYVA